MKLPSFLYARMRFGKYRTSFAKRFGKDFPNIHRQEGGFVVWVHAVSVGETKAVAPLIRLIRKERPGALIIVSNITETGFQEVIAEADYRVFLPFDFPYIIRPIVERIRPNLVIVSETDFWYHFLARAKECLAKVVLVNGKLSERSLKRYTLLPWLTAPLFHTIDLFCVQSSLYRSRFLQLGIPPDQIVVTGNLKLDGIAPLHEDMRAQLHVSNDDFVVVIGSTHDPEESMLLKELKKVWRRMSSLRVVLVPRHPERFKSVDQLLHKLGIKHAVWSKNELFDAEHKVLLVDQMGLLSSLYQAADVAIVAGSFTDAVGGHNLLEPALVGKSVLYGPHVYKQKDFAALIEEKKAGLCIEQEEIAETLLRLAKDPQECARMAEAGRQIIKEAQGSSALTWKKILTL